MWISGVECFPINGGSSCNGSVLGIELIDDGRITDDVFSLLQEIAFEVIVIKIADATFVFLFVEFTYEVFVLLLCFSERSFLSISIFLSEGNLFLIIISCPYSQRTIELIILIQGHCSFFISGFNGLIGGIIKGPFVSSVDVSDF